MSEPPSTYLDHGATTPLRAEVAVRHGRGPIPTPRESDRSHRSAPACPAPARRGARRGGGPARARSRSTSSSPGWHRVATPPRALLGARDAGTDGLRVWRISAVEHPAVSLQCWGRGKVARGDLARAARRPDAGRSMSTWPRRADRCGDRARGSHAGQQRDRRGATAAPG